MKSATALSSSNLCRCPSSNVCYALPISHTPLSTKSQISAYLSPWLLKIIYRANFPRIPHAHHVRSESHNMSILPMLSNMDIMRPVSQHPAESRDVGESGQKRARDMGKAKVGLCRMEKHHQNWSEQKQDRVFLYGGNDTGLFRLVFEKRHCGYSGL